MAGSNCFLPLHWSTQPWPRWPEELPSHLSTAGPGRLVARSSFLKYSVIVAANGWSLRFATGPVPPVTLHAWCCVFRACFLGVKKAVLFLLAKKCGTRRAQRAPPRGQGRDEAGNGLLSSWNVTNPDLRTYLKPLESELRTEMLSSSEALFEMGWNVLFDFHFPFMFLLMLMYLYLHGLTVFLGSSHANRPRNVHTKQEYDVGMVTSLPRYDSARSIQRWNVGLNHLLRSNWITSLETVWNLKKK